MQSDNPFMNDMAKLFMNGAGLAQGMQKEFQSLMMTSFEDFARKAGFAKQDEVQVLKRLIEEQQKQITDLQQRLTILEGAGEKNNV